VKPAQFYQILSSLFLERSIIFLADTLPMLSSACIGMQCFLEPFAWCHSQVPILSKDLLEITSSPIPFIVGILRVLEKDINYAEISQQCLLIDVSHNKGSNADIEITYSDQGRP